MEKFEPEILDDIKLKRLKQRPVNLSNREGIDALKKMSAHFFLNGVPFSEENVDEYIQNLERKESTVINRRKTMTTKSMRQAEDAQRSDVIFLVMCESRVIDNSTYPIMSFSYKEDAESYAKEHTHSEQTLTIEAIDLHHTNWVI